MSLNRLILSHVFICLGLQKYRQPNGMIALFDPAMRVLSSNLHLRNTPLTSNNALAAFKSFEHAGSCADTWLDCLCIT